MTPNWWKWLGWLFPWLLITKGKKPCSVNYVVWIICVSHPIILLLKFFRFLHQLVCSFWASQGNETMKHVFLFILNQIYLVAKSRVSWGSPLFRRLLITHCKSSKWELKGQSFNLLGLPLEEKKEAGCQTPGWEMGGLEADFLLQIKGGPFAYSGFFFHAKCFNILPLTMTPSPHEPPGPNSSLSPHKDTIHTWPSISSHTHLYLTGPNRLLCLEEMLKVGWIVGFQFCFWMGSMYLRA